MSLAYPVKKIKIKEVFGLKDLPVFVGAVLQTGNLLFRAPLPGSLTKTEIDEWACAADGDGRTYIVWKAVNPEGDSLVVQPWNSHYCFEVSPA